MAFRPRPQSVPPPASFAEYSDALQLGLAGALHDPVLRRGVLRMHGPGHPVAHSGNFALTFEVVVDGTTYGVRCFHKPSDSLQYRYDAISAHLRSIASPNFVACDFQPCGITTEFGTYPIVRMEWAEGETLAAFVARQLHEADVLQQLRSSLRGLAIRTRGHGIAHGDIQPSNIIVQPSGLLRLVDYDGMLVPALAGARSTELGQPNFQHPGRRAWHFNADLDAFPFALIDLALDALSRNPSLWERTASDADAFLWRSTDLENPHRSPVFRLLSSVPGLEQRVQQLAAVSVSPFERIPKLEDFLAGRNLPEVPLVFSGDATLPDQRRHVPACDVVDANNFAQCCSYVGDRIELVGQVVRVVVDAGPQPGAGCVRLEFADDSHDMVCLRIWPDAIASFQRVPDHTWGGTWVSAIGLVDPIRSTGSGAQRRKDVAMAIMDPSQFRQLTEAGALERLGALRGPARPLLDTTAGVKTVPVPADNAPPREGPEPAPRPDHIHAPQPGSQPAPMRPAGYALSVPPPVTAQRKSPARWPWWVAAASTASMLVYGFYPTQEARDQAPAIIRAGETRPADAAPPPPQDVKPSRLESQQSLAAAAGEIATVAGTLTVGPLADGADSNTVLLAGNAIPGLPDAAIVLAHRAAFSDREVIVGFTQCDGDALPCGHKVPFWLELRAGLPAELRRTQDLWSATGGGSVTASEAGVRVALGLWDGERRSATLTPAGNIVVERQREPVGRLDRADCATVLQSIDSCRVSRDCSSLAGSAQRVSASQRAQLARMYHETTGLDAAAFRGLCVRSCELGWTPSPAFVRRNVCGGAQPDQWTPGDPRAGLL